MLRKMFDKPRLARRLTVLILCVIVMGLCVAVFQQIGVGTDPCATLSKGISLTTGISYGTCLMILSFTILVAILLMRHYTTIGLGTILLMFVLGYIVDFFNWVFNSFCPLGMLSLPVKAVIFVIMMTVFLFDVAFYTVVDMGMAPYDALPVVLADKQKRLPYLPLRMGQDFLSAFVGWLLGGPVGIVTVIVCFFLGPVINMIVKKCKYLFE